MKRIVIACYRPRPGKQEDLRRLIQDHVATLRAQKLVTSREPITMEARDGTVVEVFEWASAEAIEAAHNNPVVQAMWEAYSEVCDYVPLAQVPEAGELFSEFAPVEVNPGHSVQPPARAGRGTRPTLPGRPPRNEFGDPPDTLYTGGTPLFDETGGGDKGKRRK